MTRDAFEAWVEEHYSELVGVAISRGGDEDAVQAAVLRVLSTGSYERILPPRPGDNRGGAAWTWVVNAVRSVVSHQQRTAARERAAHRRSVAGVSHGRRVPPAPTGWPERGG